MMASTNNGMEVDPPTARSEAEALGLNPLKRSNSAPMLASTAATPSTPNTSPVQATSSQLSSSFTSNCVSRSTCERIRRYSASSMSLHSPTTPVKIPSRLDQIKHEERINIKELEAAQEKDVHTSMQLSQSWEELSLNEHEPMAADTKPRPRSFQEPLVILTQTYPYTSSPSPTCIGKQCFSPSLGYPVTNVGGTLSPSPSPTRKFTRRSHSPIIFQPSRLGALKRKINVDDGGYESYSSPKRILLNNSSPGTTPESTHTVSHPLLHSISSSSMSDTSSPENQDHVIHPRMRHHTSPPAYAFHSLADHDSGHASTVSESSEVETTISRRDTEMAEAATRRDTEMFDARLQKGGVMVEGTVQKAMEIADATARKDTEMADAVLRKDTEMTEVNLRGIASSETGCG